MDLILFPKQLVKIIIFPNVYPDLKFLFCKMFTHVSWAFFDYAIFVFHGN